jgi:Protein of unknown function (DUF3891)
MIRMAEPAGWILVGHRDHARLAGELARHWGNAGFAPPEPRADLLVAVARHDDAWAQRDAEPGLTREGRPGAFSHELVGTYSAFEEIDLADYLAVRGRATEAVAADNPYAAIIVSMHTVNLLTEQADLRGLAAEKLALHAAFIAGQRRRQAELIAQVAASAGRAADVAPAALQRAFEFLQVCDNLSLIVCVDFPRPITLRHTHPRRDGTLTPLHCTPLGAGAYRVAPYPFDADELLLSVPGRRVRGLTFADETAFRAAYAAAPEEPRPVRIVR